jgi:hypothetical protein
MGMYDSVWINCPKCTLPNEVQTKVGACMLTNYNWEELVNPIT